MSVRFEKCSWIGCRRETRNGACAIHGYEPDDPAARETWAAKCASIDSQMRAQAQKDRESAERRKIQEQRRSEKKCTMCGTPLGFLDRVMRRPQHKTCADFAM